MVATARNAKQRYKKAALVLVVTGGTLLAGYGAFAGWTSTAHIVALLGSVSVLTVAITLGDSIGHALENYTGAGTRIIGAQVRASERREAVNAALLQSILDQTNAVAQVLANKLENCEDHDQRAEIIQLMGENQSHAIEMARRIRAGNVEQDGLRELRKRIGPSANHRIIQVD